MTRQTRQGEARKSISLSRGTEGQHAVPTRSAARWPRSLVCWVSLVLIVSMSAAQAETKAAADPAGPAQVRADLLQFLEAHEQSPDVSVTMPPLSAFAFDTSRYPEPIRTELISRMDPPYRGRVAVTVSLFAGERLIKRAIISPYVQIGEQVVVAARDLRRGQILVKQDLQVVERDQSRLRQGFFGQLEDVVGTRLKRSLRRGSVIAAAATEEVPVVERGDRVVIVLESGAMQLQSIGRAQEAGGIGAWIRVLNLDSKKELSGRLDRGGRVHVAF